MSNTVKSDLVVIKEFFDITSMAVVKKEIMPLSKKERTEMANDIRALPASK